MKNKFQKNLHLDSFLILVEENETRAQHWFVENCETLVRATPCGETWQQNETCCEIKKTFKPNLTVLCLLYTSIRKRLCTFCKNDTVIESCVPSLMYLVHVPNLKLSNK